MVGGGMGPPLPPLLQQQIMQLMSLTMGGTAPTNQLLPPAPELPWWLRPISPSLLAVLDCGLLLLSLWAIQALAQCYSSGEGPWRTGCSMMKQLLLLAALVAPSAAKVLHSIQQGMATTRHTAWLDSVYADWTSLGAAAAGAAAGGAAAGDGGGGGAGERSGAQQQHKHGKQHKTPRGSSGGSGGADAGLELAAWGGVGADGHKGKAVKKPKVLKF